MAPSVTPRDIEVEGRTANPQGPGDPKTFSRGRLTFMEAAPLGNTRRFPDNDCADPNLWPKRLIFTISKLQYNRLSRGRP